MSRTFTAQYLQSRSLPELYALRGTLQRELATSLPGSVERCELVQSLDRITWLLRLRAPGFKPG